MLKPTMNSYSERYLDAKRSLWGLGDALEALGLCGPQDFRSHQCYTLMELYYEE